MQNGKNSINVDTVKLAIIPSSMYHSSIDTDAKNVKRLRLSKLTEELEIKWAKKKSKECNNKMMKMKMKLLQISLKLMNKIETCH